MGSEARKVWARILVAASAGLALGACQQQQTAAVADPAALTADRVFPTGQSCSPTGKHLEHGSVACATCHQCAGGLCFDAGVAGATAAFDPITKNCSSIACHTVAAGTFTYSVWDWGADAPVDVTVPYGGTSGSTPPNWYAASGAGCGGCHGYPPTYNGVAYPWHSGTHAYGISNGNACQLCHPDAAGAYVFGGPPSYAPTSAGLVASCAPATYCSGPGSITRPALHRNGVVDVQPAWTSACIGCH